MTREDTKKIIKIMDLLPKCNDNLVIDYFDINSEKMLDEKLEVLQALVAGKTPAEIPHYYDVLELLPADQHWD